MSMLVKDQYGGIITNQANRILKNFLRSSKNALTVHCTEHSGKMPSFEDLKALRGKNKEQVKKLKDQGKILQSFRETSQTSSSRASQSETSTAVQSTAQVVGTKTQVTHPISIARNSDEKQENHNWKTAGSGARAEKVLTLVGCHQGLGQARLSRSQAHDPERLTVQPLTVSSRGDQDGTQASMECSLPKPSTTDTLIGHECFPGNSDFLLDQGSSCSTHARTSDVNSKSVFQASHGQKGDEHVLVSERHTLEPLLGYDWIAGLLDVDGSVMDRSEQFFSDLHDFRLLNKQECVHIQQTRAQEDELSPSSLSTERKSHDTEETHRCTFCYRINSRLFPTPLDFKACCPVCKIPKAQHPHTMAEPAFIRVSIPCSTLVPSSSYRAHRRSSFDPSTSLGLPSHCLSGWCNTTHATKHHLSSLDLHSSLDKVPSDRSFTVKSKEQMDISFCRVAGTKRIR
ncbi:migration and invasion-inhibitory protein isoform X2 [Arapaima gigas]